MTFRPFALLAVHASIQNDANTAEDVRKFVDSLSEYVDENGFITLANFERFFTQLLRVRTQGASCGNMALLHLKAAVSALSSA